MEKSIFYIAPETQYFNIGIQYRFSGFSQTMSLHNYGPTVRTHYIFHIILDGKGTFSVDDQQFHLSKGDIFLVRPDMIHRYISDANAPWSYCWLAIKGPVVSDFWRKHPLQITSMSFKVIIFRHTSISFKTPCRFEMPTQVVS